MTWHDWWLGVTQFWVGSLPLAGWLGRLAVREWRHFQHQQAELLRTQHAQQMALLERLHADQQTTLRTIAQGER